MKKTIRNHIQHAQGKLLVPTINLLVQYGNRYDLVKKRDWVQIYDASNKDIVVSLFIDELKNISWTEWKVEMTKADISVHSPLYRIMKAIYDGTVYISMDFEADEIELDKFYEGEHVNGYYI